MCVCDAFMVGSVKKDFHFSQTEAAELQMATWTASRWTASRLSLSTSGSMQNTFNL